MLHPMEIAIDEHITRCSICGRNLIVKDNMNNEVAFVSHLEFDHYIRYTVPQMTQTRVKKRDATTAINQQMLSQPE
jgi:hypothetical protein